MLLSKNCCYICDFVEIMAPGRRPAPDWAAQHPLVGEEGLMSPTSKYYLLEAGSSLDP